MIAKEESMDDIHIGIAAPIDISYLLGFLTLDSDIDILQGMGGTAPTAITLELLKRGRKVSVFSLDPNIETDQVLNGENLTIYLGKFRKRGRDRTRDGFRAERKFITRAIKEASPDIVNAHWTYEYALGSLSANVPVLVTARDAPLRILKFNLSVHWVIKFLMACIAIHKTTYMTAVSPYIAEHLRKHFFFTKNIQIIPNGIDDNVLKNGINNAKENNKKVIFVSAANGWSKHKNEKKLLTAFTFVHKSYPFTELWMYGKGHESGGMADNWARENQVSNGVRFFGTTPHQIFLEQLSSSADVLIHPSLEESFGNIFVEAMSVGVPVIGGKFSGAVPSTLGYGKAGLLVDVESEYEMAEAMKKLIEDKTYREKLGADGKKYAFQNYRISKIVDQYEQEYSRVLRECR